MANYCPIILFAASAPQKRYFEAMKNSLDLPIILFWYKRWVWPALFLDIPTTALNNQVFLLIKRKQAVKPNKSPIYWWLFKYFTGLKAQWVYRVAFSYLKRQEGCLGVWNGKKFRQAIWVEAAKRQQKTVLYFETGPLPGFSAVDTQGVNAYSSIPRDPNFYRQYPCSINFPLFKLEKTTRPDRLPESYFFVPFQVVEDSNIFLHSDWITNMRQLYAEIEKHVLAHLDRHFVIKLHPACPEVYDDLILKAAQTKGRIQFMNDLPSTVLVEHAEAVITVNSTVGIEALMRHKKVILLGDALYGVNEMVQMASSAEKLHLIIETLDGWDVDRVLIDQFLCYLKSEYVVVGNAMNSPDKRHWASLRNRLLKILPSTDQVI